MRPDRRVNFGFLAGATLAAAATIFFAWSIISALATGEITGRYGRVYIRAEDPSAFASVIGIHVIVLIAMASAAVYVLWVRPSAIRSEVILARRLAVRSDLDDAVRAPRLPAGESTDA